MELQSVMKMRSIFKARRQNRSYYFSTWPKVRYFNGFEATQLGFGSSKYYPEFRRVNEDSSPGLRPQNLMINLAGDRVRSAFVRYAIAIVLPLLAMASNHAFTSQLDVFPVLFTFIVAIVVATWFGGAEPGLVSLAVSFAGLAWYAVRYDRAMMLSGVGAIRYGLFAATAVLVWALVAALQKSRSDLQRANLRFGGVVQISEDAIISVDEQQNITLFNPGAEKIFGYKHAEIVGRSLSLLIPERYHHVHRNHVNEFQNSPDVLRPMAERSMIYGLRRDGTEFPAEASISKFQAAGQNILTIRLRDITERKAAERGLRELAAIVESSEDAIIGENLEGIITTWNAAAQKIFGYKASEAIGRHAAMLLPLESAGEVAENVERARGGEGFRRESVRICKEGKRIAVSLTVSPIRENGGITGISTITRDISDRKRLEDQLRQSQKMEAIGRLAGGIAHDFNNLLSVIVGYTYVLQSSLPDDETLRTSAEQVMNAADKASSLTRQLLAFSRRQVLQAEVIDLNDILTGMEKMLPRVIGEDVEVRAVRTPCIKRVKADPGQIEQVIMNLVVNARDAMPHGGKLTIETADVIFNAHDAAMHNVRPGNYILLAVSDTGIGMDAETRAHIFEPFFTTKEPGQGTGLGLATVYGIVNQSGGHIWVYSEPGKGTTFKIYFPATAAESEPSRISHEPRFALTGHETVLLVEDEASLRSLIEQVLGNQGYKLLVAGMGEAALDMVKRHNGPIDLLVTDVVMPKMGGRQLAEQMKTLHPEMKIIFMSGYTNNALLHNESLDEGALFLQKPFTPDVLLRKVREALNLRVADREKHNRAM
jgi:two-component system cell cycle sensor histidine kinase/response regulator CckA